MTLLRCGTISASTVCIWACWYWCVGEHRLAHPWLNFQKCCRRDGLLRCLSLQEASPTTGRDRLPGCLQAMAGGKVLCCTTDSLRLHIQSLTIKCSPHQNRRLICTARVNVRVICLTVSLLQILHTSDLCKGDDVFFAATGVSDGDLLGGVRYFSGGATSNSIVMRSKSRTVRYIQTQHQWSTPGITNLNIVNEF